MDLLEDLSCGLYVRTSENQDLIRAKIAKAFGGKIAGRTVLDQYLKIYFTKNEDFSPEQMDEDGGFVYYPYRAEVQPSYSLRDEVTSDTQEIFIDLLSRVINELRRTSFC